MVARRSQTKRDIFRGDHIAEATTTTAAATATSATAQTMSSFKKFKKLTDLNREGAMLQQGEGGVTKIGPNFKGGVALTSLLVG